MLEWFILLSFHVRLERLTDKSTSALQTTGNIEI